MAREIRLGAGQSKPEKDHACRQTMHASKSVGSKAMKQVIVRYRVRPEMAAENERLITEVFAQLHKGKPDGLRYASFKLDDGVSFVHVASMESSDGSDPLRDLPAFQAFIKGVRDRCDEPPVTARVDIVGSYRAFGE